MKIKFEKERETKNAVRFQEIPDRNDAVMIGTLYVKKRTLKDLGYDDNKTLIVELKVE